MSSTRGEPEVTMPPTVRVAFVRGEGVTGDPVRRVVQFYVDGQLAAEHDPFPTAGPRRHAPVIDWTEETLACTCGWQWSPLTFAPIAEAWTAHIEVRR